MEVQEGNKIIAEFMGGKYLHDFDPNYITFKDISFGDLSGDYGCRIDALRFHSSWSCLMPVVEKIKDIPAKEFTRLSIEIDFVIKSLSSCQKDLIWQRATNFIRWFNTQKQ